MSTSPALPQMNEVEAGETTLFDSLARLVPPELQTDYYRVLAHTRTLGPDDEMLRILEAMGILALVTRHTPKDIADERKRIQEMLDCHLQYSDESQQKMLGYVHFIEGRLSELPSEIEAGLDPQQIVQKQLSGVLRDLTDRDGGVAARVESANRHIVNTLERRTKALDELLHEFKTDLLRIWIPLATGAAMMIGLFAGMEIQGCRDSESTPITQSLPAIPLASSTSHSPQDLTAKAPSPQIHRSPSKQAKHADK
jgi:hypothetical protein